MRPLSWPCLICPRPAPYHGWVIADCPHCHTSNSAVETLDGGAILCRQCGQRFPAPAAADLADTHTSVLVIGRAEQGFGPGAPDRRCHHRAGHPRDHDRRRHRRRGHRGHPGGARAQPDDAAQRVRVAAGSNGQHQHDGRPRAAGVGTGPRPGARTGTGAGTGAGAGAGVGAGAGASAGAPGRRDAQHGAVAALPGPDLVPAPAPWDSRVGRACWRSPP